MTTGVEKLRARGAETAIILGSGLSSVIDLVHRKPLTMREKFEEIPYSGFSEIPQPTVPGHAGRFVLGKIDNQKVIFAQGRVHLYEGYSAREVASIVRVLAGAGIKRLILTNAAGAVNPKFKPGEWMIITDHINLTGTSPLVGRDTASPARTRGRRTARRAVPTNAAQFVDLTEAYSPRLREKFRAAARKIDMVLHDGVYAGVIGPQYETPAEVRRLQKLGGDAVGMSTVLEVIQARAVGLEVAAFSCLSNLGAGLAKEKLTHEQVLEVSKNAAADFAKLLTATFS
jgi:purine-nucleoside phosphorylase